MGKQNFWTVHYTPQGPFQPLTGAVLPGTLSAWENENNTLTHLFSTETNFCLKNQGVFFLCRLNAYLFLLANWTGTCTLVHLAPEIDIVPNNPSLTIPLSSHIRAK